ncbi:ADP compounds hydrolase NudE [Lysobacter sp. HDW10]|uniref:ADP compounds hydrolase NudE n=1 Tax=Lysobacter sp. HDW10 TaxID=2714936 RepID=UPI001F0D85AB|nr:ADP compounds hydrolase NudE [Lysobacter sp. HDW10]
MKRSLPVIHEIRERDEGRGRVIEEMDLEFSNGERRVFHRVLARGAQAVCVVPLIDNDTVMLVREYAAGVHRYELGLVAGLANPGESSIDAANREMMEEIGFGARKLKVLRALSLSPRFMQHEIQVVVAADLYESKLPGDEPEPLERVPMKWRDLESHMLQDDFSDGRSLAALFIVRAWLADGGRFDA